MKQKRNYKRYKRYDPPLHNYKPARLRKDRTTGQDMCSCLSYNCDPFEMSNPFFLRKIRYRRENNLCVSCGRNPCKCKSKNGNCTIK